MPQTNSIGVMTALLVVLAGFCGCSQAPIVNDGSFLLVQTGVSTNQVPRDDLDEYYPTGARIVLAEAGKADRPIISKGLAAAGQPILSAEGSHIYFAGKTSARAEWQIFEYAVRGSTFRQVTSMPGGACNPALLPGGEIVFSSPVPGSTNTRLPALYVQAAVGPPRRLTFGLTPALDPTVLRDGRILFVSSRNQPRDSGVPIRQGLFTINSDGTELTAFALHDGGAPLIRRPRQLSDGRIAFLSSKDARNWSAEFVLMARPFLSRAALAEAQGRSVTAVDASAAGVIVCTHDGALGADLPTGDAHVIEAVPLTARPKPMGHLSTVNSQRKTGTLLCLDANLSRNPDGTRTARTSASAVRILITDQGVIRSLGTVPIHKDGSFLVQVPADIALGFETIDGSGRTVKRLDPFVWIRPGENRSCVGCHEPYNRSPGNARPIAANFPAVTPVADRPSASDLTAAQSEMEALAR